MSIGRPLYGAWTQRPIFLDRRLIFCYLVGPWNGALKAVVVVRTGTLHCLPQSSEPGIVGTKLSVADLSNLQSLPSLKALPVAEIARFSFGWRRQPGRRFHQSGLSGGGWALTGHYQLARWASNLIWLALRGRAAPTAR